MSYRPSTHELYQALCAEPAPRPPRLGRPTTDDQAALTQVARLLDTTPAQLAGRCRTAAASRLRHEAMYLLCRRGLSQSAAGRLLERDHATVCYGVGRVEADAAAVARLDALLARGAQ